jgi:hypothetical protein
MLDLTEVTDWVRHSCVRVNPQYDVRAVTTVEVCQA